MKPFLTSLRPSQNNIARVEKQIFSPINAKKNINSSLATTAPPHFELPWSSCPSPLATSSTSQIKLSKIVSSKPSKQDRQHGAGHGGDEGLEEHVGDGGQLQAHPGTTGQQSWSANSSISQQSYPHTVVLGERESSFLILRVKKDFLVLGLV